MRLEKQGRERGGRVGVITNLTSERLHGAHV